MKNKNVLLVFAALFFMIKMWAVNNPADTVSAKLSYAKSCFYSAKDELEGMLNGKIPLDYERAVFITENAYSMNEFNYLHFKAAINFHTERIRRLLYQNFDENLSATKPSILVSEDEKKINYLKAASNCAIYSYMTQATAIQKNNTVEYNRPFTYSFEDPFGSKNWNNSQVLNLLLYKKGNCYALTSLYKIFSERLYSGASIATAPGHVFIQHKDQNGTNYNVELATGSFPGNGSIETLTYTTGKAVKSGISMRNLDLRQSVAMCLVYLAKGYGHKFEIIDDDFILKCSELVLKYDYLNLNAMLLKAEVLENRIVSEMNNYKLKTVSQFQKYPSVLKQFKEYEKYITNLYLLGYREIPLEMKNILISALQKDTTTQIITSDHTPQPFKQAGLKNTTRYATLSGGIFDEIQETKPIEKYFRTVFDTKTNSIIRFEKKDCTYNNYEFDPVVFAWSVDPLASKLPGWSPYAAFSNNPILFVDDDGQFPYTIHVRSFAPPGVFEGWGFKDDNRGFSVSTSKDVTSRIKQNFTVDPTAKTFSGGTPTSDPTELGPFSTEATPTGEATPEYSTNSLGNPSVTIQANFKGSNPFIPAAPSIEVSAGIGLTENLKEGKLFIAIDLSSKKFPATEAFIQDNTGQAVFLGGAAAIGTPADLSKNDKQKVTTLDIIVNINDKGVFQSVTAGDKTYSIADFNKLGTSQPAKKTE